MTVVVIMMTTLSQFQGLPSVAAVLSGCRGSSFYALKETLEVRMTFGAGPARHCACYHQPSAIGLKICLPRP